MAVLAIDIDKFKAINDRHGHAGGDRALRRTARLLLDCVRSDDLVARLGGDEFAILQVATSQPNAAEVLLSRVFKASAATAEEEIAIRMSIGVAVSGPEWDDGDLYDLADVALYRAKLAGRNTARFFDATLREQERLRLRLSRDLEHALAAGELYIVYQPIADAASLHIRGYEALLRWRHPVLGEVSPERFIPIAESAGLIDVIGLWVADQAMAAAASWAPALSLSLNLSPIQFKNRNLVHHVTRALTVLSVCHQKLVTPARQVASAKSWLANPRVDRTAALLPWSGETAAEGRGGARVEAGGPAVPSTPDETAAVWTDAACPSPAGCQAEHSTARPAATGLAAARTWAR